MTELTNSFRITNLCLEVSVQDTETISCKPSKAKASDVWFPTRKTKTEDSSHVLTQNSDFKAPKKVNLQDIPVKDFSSPVFDQKEFEVKMEVERKTLVDTFDSQMTKKMEEMDKRISKRWEESVAKMHEEYGKKIEKYGETLKDLKRKNEEEMQKYKAQAEREIEEKHQKEYLSKVESLAEHQKQNQEALFEAVSEVKNELEVAYNQRFEKLVGLKEKEVRYETEKVKKENMKQAIAVDLMINIEKDMKVAHETELASLEAQNQKQMKVLKKDLRELQNGQGAEKIKTQLVEEIRGEYVVKEEELNKHWREKTESSKKEISCMIEQKRMRKLSQGNLDVAVEKKEMASTTKDFPKAKKAEEFNKELERKLVEREEKYSKTVEELKKELEELKAIRVPGGRLSTRRTSIERESVRESVRVSSQRNTPRSSEKGKRSCDSSFSEFTATKAVTMESTKKPPASARGRRESSLSEPRKSSRGSNRGKIDDLMKSTEVKRSLSKIFAVENAMMKQTSFSQTLQGYNPERTMKTVLKMLSPTGQSDIQYIQVDTRMESMQGPILELTRTNVTSPEETCEAKPLECEDKKQLTQMMVTPQKVCHQRSNSSLFSERGRGMVSSEKEIGLWEETLTQRDMNFHLRRASLTEREVDLKEQESERVKNVDRVYTNRYEELLKRQVSGAKKRGNSISQRKENVKMGEERSARKQGAVKRSNEDQENVARERKSVGKNVNSLKGVFEIKETDDEETKRMKKLKRTLEDQFKENDSLAMKCAKKEVDLCVNFPWRASVQPIEQEKALQGKLKNLFELWKLVEVSSFTRLAFMEEIEKLVRYEDIMQRVSQEISQIAQQAIETEKITKLLVWRGQLRDQIKVDDFAYGVYEKICAALENNNKELREALEFYQKENGKLVQFKGVDLREIIRVDSWENEYLQNSKPNLQVSEAVLKQKIC